MSHLSRLYRDLFNRKKKTVAFFLGRHFARMTSSIEWEKNRKKVMKRRRKKRPDSLCRWWALSLQIISQARKCTQEKWSKFRETRETSFARTETRKEKRSTSETVRRIFRYPDYGYSRKRSLLLLQINNRTRFKSRPRSLWFFVFFLSNPKNLFRLRAQHSFDTQIGSFA